MINVQITTSNPHGNDILVCATDTSNGFTATGIINKMHRTDKFQSTGFYPKGTTNPNRFEGTLQECVIHMITDLHDALERNIPSKRVRRAIQAAIHTDARLRNFTFDPTYADQLKLMDSPTCINNTHP